MTLEIDGISEAIGQQRAQIAGMKETMVLNHQAMDKNSTRSWSISTS